ncbi:MAG: cupin-like domain-containing protein [Rhodanobacter sp.]
MPTIDKPIREITGLQWRALPDELLRGGEPLVLRGLVADWPLVQAGRSSPQQGIDYLRRFARDIEVAAMLGPPEIRGRLFYNDDMSGLNFHTARPRLGVLLDALQQQLDEAHPAMIYLGSTTVETFFPGLHDDHRVELGDRDPLYSIWIGNRTRVPAHQDVPDNLACVAAGRRRFTLFPPDQLANLYIGPLDFTPAGQAVSLVDFAAPDLQRFPRFTEALRHAQVAELEPGDALFIPSLWWHHIEALDAFNVLLNYWWRQSPDYMDTPMNALMLAILAIRDLPQRERAAWQDVFRHYVFETSEATTAHIPELARGVLAPLDAHSARQLRARLLQRINR